MHLGRDASYFGWTDPPSVTPVSPAASLELPSAASPDAAASPMGETTSEPPQSVVANTTPTALAAKKAERDRRPTAARARAFTRGTSLPQKGHVLSPSFTWRAQDGQGVNRAVMSQPHRPPFSSTAPQSRLGPAQARSRSARRPCHAPGRADRSVVDPFRVRRSTVRNMREMGGEES